VSEGVASEPRVEELMELIRSGMLAIQDGDREALERAVAGSWHEECEWVPLLAGVEGETYHGRDGLVSFYLDLLDSFEIRYQDLELRRIANSIVVLTEMSSRGRESGVVVGTELGILCELDGDLIRRGKAYDSHAAAIAAAEELAHA